MSYTTPHSVHEYLSAACLAINHDYIIRCQRRSIADKKALLTEAREIDLCARLGSFFGPVAHLAAQGQVGPNVIDLQITAPTIRAEVKYFRPPARAWDQLTHDWDWLLATSNNGEEFRKRAWVVFWPSTSSGMFTFTNCLSVPKSHGTQYSSQDFAPFTPYAEPEMPPNGVNQRLRFRVPSRVSVIDMPDGKAVRVDIVGACTHPLWAAVYTRLTSNDAAAIPGVTRLAISNTPIAV
jgi:hypothetical protein